MRPRHLLGDGMAQESPKGQAKHHSPLPNAIVSWALVVNTYRLWKHLLLDQGLMFHTHLQIYIPKVTLLVGLVAGMHSSTRCS